MLKRIMCFGDSNTWAFKPGSFDPKTTLGKRYNENERWTYLLSKALPNWVVIEEGLNGRTTMFDDLKAGKPYRNGLAHLPMCLETHYPLDLVLFMLGSNDLRACSRSIIDAMISAYKNLRRILKCANPIPVTSAVRHLKK